MLPFVAAHYWEKIKACLKKRAFLFSKVPFFNGSTNCDHPKTGLNMLLFAALSGPHLCHRIAQSSITKDFLLVKPEHHQIK